jgi:choline dehydrogenase-like flavoprotein
MALLKNTFDYIIVGAGSAGCVLANRLSNDPNASVCLLEAGGSDNSLKVKVPAGILALYGNPKFDYGYKGIPQSELNNRRIPVNRGKALGGSSTINSMVYIRGAASDYDDCSSLGCAGWGYQDVLPIFKHLEKNLLGQDPHYHGTDGELLVDNPQDPNVVSKMFVQAAQDEGLPENVDFNAASQFGAGIYNVTQDRGTRFSSYTAFVKPIFHRANLTVLTNASVMKLDLVDGQIKGLEALVNKESVYLTCSRETILSAGAIDSPALLLRSGIGPEQELEAAGIKCDVNLPGVGKNLRDHVDGMITVRSRSMKTLGLSLKNLPAMLAAPLRYALGRKGMLSTNYVEAGGFAKTKYAESEPDVQFHFVPGYRSHRGKLVEYGHGYAIHTCVLRPQSIGELTIHRKNNSFETAIDHKFFSDMHDAHTLVEGIKIARRIFASAEFAQIRGPEILPGEEVQSDDEILAYLRAEALTVYHPVGTCKMGVDGLAVVAPDTLKVFGVENLRVADASVMPTLIGGNTNAPSMMIGQRASDMISA